MLGPFTTASRLTPIHQMSLAVLSRAYLRIDVHDANDNDDNDNAWQRGQLWLHGMGPIVRVHSHDNVGIITDLCWNNTTYYYILSLML